MKYPYVVAFNDVWYPAGTEVPVGDVSVDVESQKTEKKYSFTKSEINRMAVADLKIICEKEGIKAEELSGAEMKKLLLERYQL